jgi:hypothetical protein
MVRNKKVKRLNNYQVEVYSETADVAVPTKHITGSRDKSLSSATEKMYRKLPNCPHLPAVTGYQPDKMQSIDLLKRHLRKKLR